MFRALVRLIVSCSTMKESLDLGKLKIKAENFVKTLKPCPNQASVITLKGDLGSGKTTFVQFVAHTLGVKENVTSPTFIIMRTYPLGTRGSKWQRLVHIDAYRLEHADELASLGWEDLAKDPGNLIFIEWPEKVEAIIPKDAVRVEFSYADETHRYVSIVSRLF